MTTPTGLSPDHRPRSRSGPAARAGTLVAGLLVTLLAATGLVGISPVGVAGAAAAGPAISVSKTSGFDPEGTETITVTGVGFTDTANGTRPPLMGQPAGVYVVFGRFAETWQPSAGAPSSTRQVISQKWALPASSRAQLDPTSAQSSYVTIAEDGTFTADLEVEAAEGTGDYAVVTYPGSGATNAAHELHQPMTFAAPSAEPAISVSKTSGFDPEGTETVTVTGVGFTETANGTRPPLMGQPAGVYVVFGRFAETWRPSAGAPSSARQVISQKWALPASSRAQLDPTGVQSSYVTIAEDGTFTADLEVEAAEGTGDYAVVTYPGSGATNAAHELHQPMTFDEGTDPVDPDPVDPDPVDPDPVDPDPVDQDPVDGPNGSRTGFGVEGQELTVTPADDLDPDGQTITVTGEGYDPAKGVYVALCVDNGPTQAPSPCVGGVDMEGDGGSSAFISSDPRFAGLATPWGAGGTFDVELTIAASDDAVDCLDGVVTCKVVTRADHTNSTDRTADVKVPVHWAGQPPLVPEEEPEPGSVVLDRTEVRAGEQLTATGTGFVPGEQVQVWMFSEPQFLDVVVADDDGVATATVTIPADAELGEHHLEMRGVTSGAVIGSETFTVLAAATAPALQPVTNPGPAVGSGSLPRTGGGTSLLGMGVWLTIAGGGALVLSRRLRSTVDAR